MPTISRTKNERFRSAKRDAGGSVAEQSGRIGEAEAPKRARTDIGGTAQPSARRRRAACQGECGRGAYRPSRLNVFRALAAKARRALAI